jgi:hypothetical protein
MRVGFLVTTPYQLFHYKWIAPEFDDVTAILEVRDRDLGLDEGVVRQQLPTAKVAWVPKGRLEDIDGIYDIVVCQTPILPHRFLSRTLVVAQQYSLAKEAYQYGPWRMHADLNLMYGPYSVHMVDRFCNATAVGNPLLDPLFANGRLPPPPVQQSNTPKLLYMPTYGGLSSLPRLAPILETIEAEITVKLHHAEDRSILDLLPPNCVPAFSDSDPVLLLREADAVISDFSGGAYDALYARKPVVFVGDADPTAADFTRLSTAELSNIPGAHLAVHWDLDEPFLGVLSEAYERIGDDSSYRSFIEHRFANPGRAGVAAADAIRRLAEGGEPEDAVREWLRAASRAHILKSRQLQSRVRELEAERSISDEGEPRTAREPRGETIRQRLRHLLAAVPPLARLVRWARSNRVLTAPPQPRPSPKREVEQRPHTETQELEPAIAAAPWHRRATVLRALTPRLESAGIQHAVDESCTGGPVLAIRESNKRQLTEVLRHLGGDDHPRVEVRMMKHTREISRSPASQVEFSEVYDATWLAVGEPLSVRSFRLNADGHLKILFVTWRDRVQRWVATHIAWRADWTEAFEAPSHVGDPEDAVLRRVVRPLYSSEPIDVVYTWVDSQDPEWRRRHQEHSGQHDTPLLGANNAERYLNREELRYSLRSLELFAPFVRHIYVVTADQTPDWLATDHPRLTMVSHRDIFPEPAMLPTFNSHAIEACLHRIEGLSEHFLYLNDDVILGREVNVEDFFTRAGQIKVRFSADHVIYQGSPLDGAIPTDWAAFNANTIMQRDFGMWFGHKLQHVPLPQRRSVAYEIEDRYPSEVRATRLAKFRSNSDLAIPSMFAPYFSIATMRAVEWPDKRDYVYADTGREHWSKRVRQIQRRRPKFVCINSTRHTEIELDQQARNVHEFLENWLPFPSSYERSSPHVPDGALQRPDLTLIRDIDPSRSA